MPHDIGRRGINIPPTETEAEALDVTFDVLATGARRNERSFTDPDDDWMPVWLVVTKRQGTLVFGNAHKDVMVDYVARLARRFGAVCIGHLHSSWVVLVEDVGEERMREIHRHMLEHGGSTEGIPERREIVMIGVYTASIVRQYHAAIHRRPDRPPELGPFELVSDSQRDGAHVEGGMVDPLRDALQRIG